MARRPDRATLAMIENYGKKDRSELVNESARYTAQKEMDNIHKDLYAAANETRLRTTAYNNFLMESKESLLSECIYKILSESVDVTKKTEQFQRLQHSMCLNFVKEQGVNNLLRSYATKSELLSEMACIVNRAYDKIVESTDKTDSNSFVIDGDIKSDFYEDLLKMDSDEVASSIKQKVADAINDFNINNRAAKIEIEDALNAAKGKIESTDKKELAEAYEMKAKRKVLDIRHEAADSTIYGKMVHNFSKSAFTNELLKESYMKDDNHLNMEKVNESCEIMYTFLEALNTAKLLDVTPQYIEEVLDSMNA